MPGSDELYPPTQYGWGWVLLALGVLALAALAVWLIVALTRPRAQQLRPGDAAPIPTADVLTQLRAEYDDLIRRIETDYRDGRLSARNANLELSRVVRAFVNEYSGLEAPVLTLDDLVSRGVHPALIDAVGRHYYPSIFRREPAIDPVVGAQAARTVVQSWQ